METVVPLRARSTPVELRGDGAAGSRAPWRAQHPPAVPRAAGGRFALAERRLVRSAWTLIAIGVIVPILAALGGVLGAIMFRGGKHVHGAVLAVLGPGVVAVRLVLWLG